MARRSAPGRASPRFSTPGGRIADRVARAEGVEVAQQQVRLAGPQAEQVEDDRDLCHGLGRVPARAEMRGKEV